MNRLAPLAILVLVTALFIVYGRFSWSPLAGPAAALFLVRIAR